jgi:hypothetical protein
MTDFVITEHDIELFNDPVMDKKKIWVRVHSRTLSDELESAYKNGFNDGQAEGMPGSCVKCLEEDKTTMLEHDTAIRNATLDLIIKFRKDNAKEYKIHDMWVAEAEYLQSLRTSTLDEVSKIVYDIERMACTCMWSDSLDCPGQSNGECNCDGCERYEFVNEEDLRKHIHEKAESLRTQQEHP